MDIIKIKGLKLDMTDKEVKDITRKETNGDYCTQVCKGCGMYHTDPEGNLNIAHVVSTCKECFIEK